jgi:type I restriction enzyme R subunit
MTKLIVLDKTIGSMTEFKQIIGRGTRIRENEGKTNFTVMDFRGVTRLFADPDWDGPIEQNDGFGKVEGVSTPIYPEGANDPPDPPYFPKPYVDIYGCPVTVINKTVSVYDSEGKLLRQENIIDYTRTNIVGAYASLENFINQWTAEDRKQKVQELLRARGIDLNALKNDQQMNDVDDFDFICHIAFNQKTLTRKERADQVKKRDFLSKYKGVAREVLETLLEKYMDTGIYEIEKTEVLRLNPFNKMGKPSRIIRSFGGKDGYLNAVRKLEEELYRIA